MPRLMHKQSLHSDWSLRAVNDLSAVPAGVRGHWFGAWVPSCVHTVLLHAGAIDDPYLRDNELKQLWIGETDWEYRCEFEASAELFDHERIDLACDGLDTIATLRLNDIEIGRSEDMHTAARFNARGALKRGRNELSITFASPVKYARHWEKALGPLPHVVDSRRPFNFIRKMACNFGWDWGPVVTTSGIWKGVRLEGWSQSRLDAWTAQILRVESNCASVRVQASWELDFDTINVDEAFVEDATGKRVGREIEFKGGDFRESRADTRWRRDHWDYAIDCPKIWWPRSHGEQPLYRIGMVRNGYFSRKNFGLRTVELDTSPDAIGRGFTLQVNGKPIFCRGFNWIPDDCFLDRACTRERYRTRIQQAVDAGANMLRVWGGGIYETDDFYDICDELGVMVWQDFPFACAAYPEEEPFKSLVEAEARQNVIRLSSHPSLVLWNGCNENLWGYRDWGWPPKVKDRTWGAGYYLDLLPKIVAECDPSRPYWAASPWSGDRDVDGLHPNLETHGNKHIWEVWHGTGDYDNYRQFTPRFCSEFGYQAPPNYATFAEALGEENLVRGNPLFALHQKSPNGDERNERLAAKDFDLADLSYDDLHYVLQLNQARALQTGCEWFRSRYPICMGTLYWQFNDCYPVTSWSAIDSAGRKKLLWYATRRFYRDRLLTIQPAGAGYKAGDPLWCIAINDTDEAWDVETAVERRRFDGEVRASANFRMNIDARSVTKVELPAELAQKLIEAADEYLVVAGGGERAWWYFARDRDSNYPAASVEVESLLLLPVLSPLPVRRESVRVRAGGDIATANSNIEEPSPPPSPGLPGEGVRVRIRAHTFIRDLCFMVDRIDPAATISDQLFTLQPGEFADVEIQSATPVTVEQLLSPAVMKCANQFGQRS